MLMENYLGGPHWCRKAQPNVGSTICWSAGPAMDRKLAKREPLSHLHSFCFRILPWVPALTSLSDGFFSWKCKPNKFFFPWVAFGHDICCSNRGVTRTFLKRRPYFLFESVVLFSVGCFRFVFETVLQAQAGWPGTYLPCSSAWWLTNFSPIMQDSPLYAVTIPSFPSARVTCGHHHAWLAVGLI